jgi:hypothetical protein
MNKDPAEEGAGASDPVKRIQDPMKIKIAFIVAILAALVCIGGSQTGVAHEAPGHAAHQSKKARAVAKCRLKSTAEERKACLAKVKARFSHRGGHK